ncbi:MAG: DUF4861 family protein [Paludibacteraceae bacterium]|nr:DUF4861 family protein [Paludibacteraceae bacterium]
MKKIIYIFAVVCCLTACQKEAEEQQQKVYGRYVPERKDDFAWENEYAAYRFYGPALAPENPSNGVDIFMKNTPAFVLDTFFYNYVNHKIPYHVQHGIGFDGYKVAHTTGCGGPAIVVDGQLYVGDQYDTWEILEQTPTKLVFRLHYDTLMVAGCPYAEDITITCCAGTMLNRADLVLTPLGEQPDADLYVGAGLYLHDSIGTYQFMLREGAIVYTETALSDPGAVRLNKKWYDNTELGETHEVIIVPGSRLEIIANTAVATSYYFPGQTQTYWFGGCWSGWTDGERSFPTQEAWIEAIKEEIKTL